MTWNPLLLGMMFAAEIVLLAVAGKLRKLAKAILGVGFVAIFFALIQLPFDVSIEMAAASGLKMMVMTTSFFILFAVTRMPSLTAALVSQVKIPYEYAFMFTSALRFVPDFLAESHAVREAQTCRGYMSKGNPLRRLMAYAALVEPMVLRAINRSETMAMSMELRGFGSANRTTAHNIAFASRDYAALLLMSLVTAAIILKTIKF